MRTGLGPIYGSETTTKAVQSRIRIDSALSSRLGICQGARGVALDMSRIHPERPASDPSDRSIAADVLLRQEPDEEEDEEEDEGDGKEDDDDDDKDDDGYSE